MHLRNPIIVRLTQSFGFLECHVNALTDDSHDWEETREPQSGLNSDHKGNKHKDDGTQTVVKPFSCSVCGKSYRQKKFFTTHMICHSEGKCFSCSFCDMTFQRRGGVVRHMNFHKGEKPFSCSIFGKGFVIYSRLTAHLRVQTLHMLGL